MGGVGVHSEGRAYPVDVHYLPRPDERPVADVVADGVRRALRHDGDVLAFLPGARSIRWTAERLAGCGAEVVPLYGALSADAQDRALRPGAGRRVVLATNLAESSLTVPGVRTVVDAGWVKQLEHDPGTGLDRLRRVRIPVDSADQRAGRAGREAPGRCLRLWTERQQAAMAPRQLPEVARLDLAGPALQLLAWGDDPSTFAWFEVPPEHHLDAALELLDRLGARHQGRITATGRQLAALPLHPRLGVLLVEAARRGHAELGAWAAALLSERDPLSGPPEGPSTGSDLLDRVEAVRAGQGRGGARQAVAQVAKRLVGLAPRPEERVDADEALGRAVLAAWPDRVVRRRDDGVRGRMVGGKGVSLERSRVRSELLVAVDASPGSEAEVRVASPVRAAWLPTEERVVAELVGTKVSARRVVAYGDLELSSHPAPVDRRAAGQALERWGHDHPQAVQPTGEGWSQLLGRLRWARGHDQRLPEVDDELIRSLLPLVCAGKRSVAEVQSADWVGALRDTLGWPLFQRLQQLAPERIDLPKGRSAALDWSGPRPVLAVQLQRLLGLRRTPRVGDGREPVLLHLLAPNRRVAQITDDLEGFWTGSYAEVRKQLRARYPKHAWPEDPLQANG
jgi:ATP-dependent helicase HrpB